MDKPALRAHFHNQRKQLSKAYQATANKKIINTIKHSDFWSKADSVAVYLPFNMEADIIELLDSNKDIYLPSIKNKDMQFQLFTKVLPFETLSYGLIQPKFISKLKKPIIDLYLIPLLAYDLKGNRLGMGGGFYDRYFANQPTGIRAGVAYHCQQAKQLPTDDWDVKLQAIFTEQGLLNL